MRISGGFPVVLVLLAGCTANSPDLAEPMEGGSDDSALGLNPVTSLPGEVEELLPPADPWNGTKEMVLMEDVVEAVDCGPIGGFLRNPNRVSWETRDVTAIGCAIFSLPKGRILPEGAESLRVEADAAEAHRIGSFEAVMKATHGRSEIIAPSADEDVHSFLFALEPSDWDVQTEKETRLLLGFRPSQESQASTRGGLLLGPIRAKVVAVRDSDWRPLSYEVNWAPAGASHVLGEGVLGLLEYAGDLRSGSGMERRVSPVPANAKYVAYGAAWEDIQGCRPTDECGVSTSVYAGGNSLWSGVDASGPKFRIHVFDVPQDVPADGPYVQESGMSVQAALSSCIRPCEPVEVDDPVPESLGTKVRVRVEAWKGKVDLDAVKQRLEVS